MKYPVPVFYVVIPGKVPQFSSHFRCSKVDGGNSYENSPKNKVKGIVVHQNFWGGCLKFILGISFWGSLGCCSSLRQV